MKLMVIITLGAICLLFNGCKSEKEFDAKSITPQIIAHGELFGNDLYGVFNQNQVIKTQTELNELIALMNSVSDSQINFFETEIDFSIYQVLAIFDIVRSSNESNIKITNITEFSDKLIVNTKITSRKGFWESISQSCRFMKLPKTSKKIIFEIEEDSGDEISLKDTQWKLAGIVNLQTNELKVLKPEVSNCIKCYTLLFNSKSIADGFSTFCVVRVNLTQPECLISIIGGQNERDDGYLFQEAINLVTSYSIKKSCSLPFNDGCYSLNFFYKEDEIEYCLKYYKI